MREQIKLLEHQSHISGFDDLAAVRCLKTCGTAQDGGLAGTGRTDDT